MIYLPEKIKAIVGDKEYHIDGVGMSDSKVLIYDEYVLKIQPHSEESDNEKSICDWLGGCVSVPEIPVYLVEEGKAYTLMTRVEGEMLCADIFLDAQCFCPRRRNQRIYRFGQDGACRPLAGHCHCAEES